MGCLFWEGPPTIMSHGLIDCLPVIDVGYCCCVRGMMHWYLRAVLMRLLDNKAYMLMA